MAQRPDLKRMEIEIVYCWDEGTPDARPGWPAKL